jgi:RNA polymerase primary sigma factor
LGKTEAMMLGGPDPIATADTEGLETYFKRIRRYPLLTSDEERMLAKAMGLGAEAETRLLAPELSGAQRDSLRATLADGRRARTRLINSNLRFVVMVARRQRNAELPLTDLIQIGNVGLIRAADKFDWRRGVRFATHAAWWIRQALSVGIEQTARVIRLPRTAREELGFVIGEFREVESRTGVAPSPTALAKRTGLTQQRVSRVLEYPSPPVSLDAPNGTDPGAPTPLVDLIPDRTLAPFDETVIASIMADMLRRYLGVLPEIQRRVLELRFGLSAGQPESITETARVLGLSRGAVRSHETSAVAALRKALCADVK